MSGLCRILLLFGRIADDTLPIGVAEEHMIRVFPINVSLTQIQMLNMLAKSGSKILEFQQLLL